jgi:hypothetical protein
MDASRVRADIRLRPFVVNSAEDKKLPDEIYIEAADAFRAATDVFLRYVHGWVFTKANPELVQRWKKERDDREHGA